MNEWKNKQKTNKGRKKQNIYIKTGRKIMKGERKKTMKKPFLKQKINKQ